MNVMSEILVIPISLQNVMTLESVSSTDTTLVSDSLPSSTFFILLLRRNCRWIQHYSKFRLTGKSMTNLVIFYFAMILVITSCANAGSTTYIGTVSGLI